MKKIVASVGLAALGASSLQAAPIPGITAPDAGKPWTISATIRGFYDDNINSAPDHLQLYDASGAPLERDGFGFEVSPSVALAFPWEQTMLSLGYTYSFKYYAEKLYGTDGHDDQTHEFNLALSHTFSERYSLSLRDSFVIGQEPDLLRVGNTMETFQRVPGDNIRNFGAINFDGQATRLLSYEIGYANSFFDYDDTDPERFLLTGLPTIGGLLNRLEHVAHLDGRWQVLPETVGVLGYQFREVDYIADEQIAGDDLNRVMSDARNARIHYGYVGVDHTFRPDLTGSLRGGVQFAEYYNSPGDEDQVSPYVLASLKWTYLPESYAEVGFTHDINATDQYLPNNVDDVTLSAESSVGYLSIRHRITPKLFGGLLGQVQYSEYNGGLMDNQADWFFMAGVNLEYQFTPNFSAHVGYSYDRLDSDQGDARNFDRNRVYIGLTARY